MRTAPLRHAALATLACTLAGAAGGCALFGFAAYAAPKPPIAAAYKGLAGRSTAVMVWVDRSIRIDNPSLALDIANGIDLKLKAATADKKEDVALATYPIQPRSVCKYQAEHPEIDAQPISEVAPIFNVERLIYVEITDFSTRPNGGVDLLRGAATASLKVVEVDSQGRAKLAFQQNDIRVTFPKKGPPEGLPGSNDQEFYQGTVALLTQELAEKFYKHDAPEDE